MPYVKAIGTRAHTHTHTHTGGAGVVASCVMLWSEYTLKTTVMLDRAREFSLSKCSYVASLLA